MTPVRPCCLGLLSDWRLSRLSPLAIDLCYVLRGGTLISVNDVELYVIALVQRLETVAADGREMHEHVLGSVVRRDEAETLTVIEPLHYSGRTHLLLPLSFRRRAHWRPTRLWSRRWPYCRPRLLHTEAASGPAGPANPDHRSGSAARRPPRPSGRRKGPASCTKSLIRVLRMCNHPNVAYLLETNIASAPEYVKRICNRPPQNS